MMNRRERGCRTIIPPVLPGVILRRDPAGEVPGDGGRESEVDGGELQYD